MAMKNSKSWCEQLLAQRKMNEDQRNVARLRAAVTQQNWPHPTVMDAWTFLVLEVSEVGDLLIRAGYGERIYVRNYPDPEDLNAEMVKEIGDVLLMLCTLANHLDIDISSALAGRIEYLKEKHGAVEDME